MEEAVFLNLLQESEARLQRVCRFYCSQLVDQEDLMQEIVFQCWRSRAKFRGEAQWSTYLYRIALNTALTFVRKEKRKRHRPLEESTAPIEKAPSIEQQIDQAQQHAFLFQAIHRLKKLDQTLILLYLEELSYREMAEITGLSESNVGVKINRIKKRLHKQLSVQL